MAKKDTDSARKKIALKRQNYFLLILNLLLGVYLVYIILKLLIL